MVPCTIHSCITIQIIELQVWTIIVFLFMHRVTLLQYERLGMMTPKDIQCSIIKMAVMAIVEQHLGIQGRRAMYGGEMGHVFMSPIAIHIYRQTWSSPRRPLFYMRSNLSALQNCALNFSTNFQFFHIRIVPDKIQLLNCVVY